MRRRKFIGTALASGMLLSRNFRIQASEHPAKSDFAPEPVHLDIRFLGTGAADWDGKDERGELRRLTSILVDGKYLIDFTPSDRDMLPEGIRPQAIFYTHSHNDHYNPEAALEIGIEKAYMGDTWSKASEEEFRQAASRKGMTPPAITGLSIGQSILLDDNLIITALPANHATNRKGEQTLMYLLEKGPVRLLYATDTGGIPAIAARLAGIDAHVSTGKPITALIMEATMGMDYTDDFRIYTHSSVETVAQIVRVLDKTGRYKPSEGQKVYLTHMARTLHPTQEALDRTLPQPLKAAYDGLEVSFF